MNDVLRQHLTRRSTALVVVETLLIVAVVALSAYLRLGGEPWILLSLENGVPKALLIAIVCQLDRKSVV